MRFPEHNNPKEEILVPTTTAWYVYEIMNCFDDQIVIFLRNKASLEMKRTFPRILVGGQPNSD